MKFTQQINWTFQTIPVLLILLSLSIHVLGVRLCCCIPEKFVEGKSTWQQLDHKRRLGHIHFHLNLAQSFDQRFNSDNAATRQPPDLIVYGQAYVQSVHSFKEHIGHDPSPSPGSSKGTLAEQIVNFLNSEDACAIECHKEMIHQFLSLRTYADEIDQSAWLLQLEKAADDKQKGV